MILSIDKKRTVATGIEYPDKSPYRKYEIHYLISNKDHTGKVFDTFDEAFHAARELATAIAANDNLDISQRKHMLKTLYVFDSLEERDVTTAELKNCILDIVKSL